MPAQMIYTMDVMNQRLTRIRVEVPAPLICRLPVAVSRATSASLLPWPGNDQIAITTPGRGGGSFWPLYGDKVIRINTDGTMADATPVPFFANAPERSQYAKDDMKDESRMDKEADG